MHPERGKVSRGRRRDGLRDMWPEGRKGTVLRVARARARGVQEAHREQRMPQRDVLAAGQRDILEAVLRHVRVARRRGVLVGTQRLDMPSRVVRRLMGLQAVHVRRAAAVVDIQEAAVARVLQRVVAVRIQQPAEGTPLLQAAGTTRSLKTLKRDSMS